MLWSSMLLLFFIGLLAIILSAQADAQDRILGLSVDELISCAGILAAFEA
jgi:hypothetical protein